MKEQIDNGVLGSINNALEIEVVQTIVDMVPCAEMVKFCKSGGEAEAIAIRIARGYTGKEKVMFRGYHSWHDWYLAANLASDSSLNQHLLPGLNPKSVPASLSGTCLLLNTITGHGFDFTINFNYAKALAKIITLFIQEMVMRGIYTNDVFYLCFTHTSEDIDKILFAAAEIFTLIKNGLENKNIEQLLKCPIRQTGFRRLA